MDENQLAGFVVGAAIAVHREPGPDLLESAYSRTLAQEFGLRGIPLVRQLPVGLRYRDPYTGNAYCLDIFVGSKIVVELKVVQKLRDEHRAQLLTYLRWTDCRLALLIDFHALRIRHGMFRVAKHV